jgi:hypothetical protein
VHSLVYKLSRDKWGQHWACDSSERGVKESVPHTRQVCELSFQWSQLRSSSQRHSQVRHCSDVEPLRLTYKLSSSLGQRITWGIPTLAPATPFRCVYLSSEAWITVFQDEGERSMSSSRVSFRIAIIAGIGYSTANWGCHWHGLCSNTTNCANFR